MFPHRKMFLLKNHIYQEAAPIADEFMIEASKPDQIRSSEHRPWGLIARDFAEEESNRSNAVETNLDFIGFDFAGRDFLLRFC
jgi:hypothetical protein